MPEESSNISTVYFLQLVFIFPSIAYISSFTSKRATPFVKEIAWEQRGKLTSQMIRQNFVVG